MQKKPIKHFRYKNLEISYIWKEARHSAVSQILKNEPVNVQKPAAYLPIVLNNNKNNNKFLKFESYPIVIFVIVKHMCPQLKDLLHILRDGFWQNDLECIGTNHLEVYL